MSQNVVPRAVKHGSQSATEAVDTVIGRLVRCSPRFVPSVVRIRKSRFSHAKTDQCIAVTATVK